MRETTSTVDRLVNTPASDTTVEIEETEVEDNSSQTEEPKIPEKFKGKTVKEIVDSYMALETAFGRQGRELGEHRGELKKLRSLTDEVLQRELSRGSSTTTEPADDFGDVDFSDNPSESVKKVVKQELDQTLRPVKEELEEIRVEKARSVLQAKHPDAQEIVNSEAFQSWVMGSSVRKELFHRAYNEANLSCADELLSTFKSLHKAQQADTELQKDEKKAGKLARAKQLSTETGSTAASSGKKYKRADIINLMATKPHEYERRRAEFRKAYEEGRVV